MGLLPDLPAVHHGVDLPDRARRRYAGTVGQSRSGCEKTPRPVRPRSGEYLARRRTPQASGVEGKGRAERRRVPEGEGETARLTEGVDAARVSPPKDRFLQAKLHVISNS